jgi:hypothetical protein
MKLNNVLEILMEPQVLMIMAFYAVITFVVGPIVGGYLFGRRGVGHGYLVGGIISLMLFHFYGSKVVRM